MIVYSRTALASDTEGNLTRLTTTGPERQSVMTYDNEGKELLRQILKEMENTNFHLSLITENFVEEI